MLSRPEMLRPFVTLFVLGMATTAIAQPEPAPDQEPPPVEPEPEPERPPPEPPPSKDESVDARLSIMEQQLRELERARVHDAAKPQADQRAEDDAGDTGFRFGSYGRVIAGTDLRGGRPEPVNVVAHGPRIVEPTYLELDFQYLFRSTGGLWVRTVTTLAFGDRLFHETGEFDARPALRNLFAEVAWERGARVWVGSRMYRGDDIYLFDYWPLDDQNTVGAGYQQRVGAAELAAHAGVNRLLNDYQFQERQIADPELGATTVTQLDRQRMIASASITYFAEDVSEDLDAKLKLHGELQGLPSGTRLREGDDTPEALPADWGTTLGAQLGVWQAADDQVYRRHANLFARWSKGLAAFDELAPPFGFGTDLKVFPRASEIVLGVASNWDDAWGHVLFGANARRFVDADVNTRDVDDGWEYAVDVRPMAKLRPWLLGGVDLSYQARFPRGLMPATQLAADPGVVSIAPMLALTPIGASAHDRPQLRLVYRAARQNAGAQALFAEDDPRRTRTWMHFLGVQAEWWFNSTSYR